MLVAVTQGVHTALFSEGFCGTDLMGQNCPFAPGFPLFQFWEYFGFLIFFLHIIKEKKENPNPFISAAATAGVVVVFQGQAGYGSGQPGLLVW